MLQGGLFTRDWLTQGILESGPSRALDDAAVDHARGEIGNLFRSLLKRERLIERTASIRSADSGIADWLKHEIGLVKLPIALTQASCLNSDGFVTAVRAALPKRAGITPTRLAQLRAAFADTAEPARAARAAALGDERMLSDIVNRAYGLTPEDVALMWRTAPPRMPLPSPLPTESASPDAAADLL